MTVLSRKSGGSGGGGAPSGPAGGSLTGTYPDPTLAAGVGVFNLVLDTTLGAPAATIDTTPTSLAGYTHLRAYLTARASPATNQQTLLVRFNNDSGNNYESQTYSATGGSLGAASQIGTSSLTIGFVTAASSTAGEASGFTFEIPDYAGTTFNKTLTQASSTPHGGTFSFLGAAGHWISTAAITRITFLLDSGNFITGSRLTIYGIG